MLREGGPCSLEVVSRSERFHNDFERRIISLLTAGILSGSLGCMSIHLEAPARETQDQINRVLQEETPAPGESRFLDVSHEHFAPGASLQVISEPSAAHIHIADPEIASANGSQEASDGVAYVNKGRVSVQRPEGFGEDRPLDPFDQLFPLDLAAVMNQVSVVIK